MDCFTSLFRYLGIGRRSARSTLPLWNHVFCMYLFSDIYMHWTASMWLKASGLILVSVCVHPVLPLETIVCRQSFSSPLRYWSLFLSFTYVTGTNDCSVRAVRIYNHMCSMPLASNSPSACGVRGCLLFIVAVSLVYFMSLCVQNLIESNLNCSSCHICLHAHITSLQKQSNGPIYLILVSVCICFPCCESWWWWQWWDYGMSVCSSSTVSPHGLLPPLSFYSLLLGDASLSPKVTQAKTPLSSFARAGYPGNSDIPPLLFCTHLLSSFFLHTSNPPPLSLQPRLDTEFVFGARAWRWDLDHSVQAKFKPWVSKI